MLRFAFKPRHPITQVAFTADGREVITAQPFTGIAVRDRLTGEARLTFPLARTPAVHALIVHPTRGWLAIHRVGFPIVLDPTSGWVVRRDTAFASRLTPTDHVFLERWEMAGEAYTRAATTRFPIAANLRAAMPADGRTSLWVWSQGVPQLTAFPPADVVVRLNSRIRGRHVEQNRAVIAFSPDGLKFALGDGETLAVFDLTSVSHLFDSTEQERATLDPLFTLDRPDPTQHGTHADMHAEHWLPPVAFDHAGRTLFTLGLRNRVQRIDLATGGVMNEWGWRCEPIRSLAVSPDDLTAAAGCQRGELVLWDLE